MTTKKCRMWKDSARRGIVYVEEREAAEKVMALGSVGGGAAAPPARASQQRRSTLSVTGAAGRVAPPVPASPGEAELRGSAAMAVYLDRKGKPFAWQIPFAMEFWDRVTALVGAEAA